jgi:hypothetical protein
VKHAFERCQANAFGFNPTKGGRSKRYDGKLAVDETTLLFHKKVAPSLRLATRIGPQHTVATYTNITSLLIHAKPGTLLGKTINVYSYGSGAASTMFRLKVKRMPGYVKNMHTILDQRNFVDAKQFDSIMDEYAETYARFDWTARVRNGPQPGGAYYLKDVDKYGRRGYYQIKDPLGMWKLPPPYVNEPPPRSSQEDVERVKASLPERYRDAPDFTHVTGLNEPFPLPPPREVTDEEMIELGLMERPPAPPPPPAAPPGGGLPDLSNVDQATLAALLQALAAKSN